MKKTFTSLLLALLLCAICAGASADKSPLNPVLGKWSSSDRMKKVELDITNIDSADGNKYGVDGDWIYGASVSLYSSPDGTMMALFEKDPGMPMTSLKYVYQVYLSNNNSTMLWVSDPSQNSEGELVILSFSKE